MLLKSWILKPSLQALMLCCLGSGVCLASSQAKCVPDTASCCEDDSSTSGCAEAGCGEDIECGGCDYEMFDCEELFGSVLGDEPLLKGLKNQKVGSLTYSAGAELRYRHMNEKNRLRPGGPGQSSYELWRFTPYVQANYNDLVGGYVQAIDASMFGLDAPYTPSQIDVNRTDLLQYYAELNVGDVGDGNLKYRYGRQFLQYGGQRLLSSLGWANTFRNFEGHKLVYTSDNWDVDAFAMQSVNAVSGNDPQPYSFDRVDKSRWISGVYSTWKGIENNNLDLYYLRFDESDSSAALQDGRRNTLGARLAGKQLVKDGKTLVGTWNWDVEGAWQFGEDNFGSGRLPRCSGWNGRSPRWIYLRRCHVETGFGRNLLLGVRRQRSDDGRHQYVLFVVSAGACLLGTNRQLLRSESFGLWCSGQH